MWSPSNSARSASCSMTQAATRSLNRPSRVVLEMTSMSMALLKTGSKLPLAGPDSADQRIDGRPFPLGGGHHPVHLLGLEHGQAVQPGRHDLRRPQHPGVLGAAVPPVQVVPIVTHGQQRPTRGQRRGRGPGQGGEPIGGRLDVGDEARVDPPRRGPVGEQVGVHPVHADPAAGRQPGRPGQPDPGEVHPGDSEAALGQPDRVPALAGAQVDGPARRQLGQFLGHEAVRPGAPDQLGTRIPFIPGGLIHRTPPSPGPSPPLGGPSPPLSMRRPRCDPPILFRPLTSQNRGFCHADTAWRCLGPNRLCQSGRQEVGARELATAMEPLSSDAPAEIGGYKVRSRLGAGGMGRVYLASTPGGRRVALKVVRPELGDDPDFRTRFRQEIAAAQRVRGLYTAELLNADPEASPPWLVTAYVPGPSLQQAIASGGPMPGETVTLLMAGIAEALQAIHGAGVVHRDLKPSNVLLAPDGPRVIDFGIARAAESASVTRSGIRVGSPQFMAPEQIRSTGATPAVDIFALGSVAAFAATGRAPFGEGDPAALMYRVLNEQPNLTGCSGPVRDLIERCLAKGPAARPNPSQIIDTCRAMAQGNLGDFSESYWPTLSAPAQHGTMAAPGLPRPRIFSRPRVPIRCWLPRLRLPSRPRRLKSPERIE